MKWFERIWPYVVPIIWTFVWWWALNAKFPAEPSGLLSASGTASAVLVGFLATANAIVIGLGEAEIMKRLKSGGYLPLIHAYFYEAILAAILFLLVSIIGFFLSKDASSTGTFPVVWMLVGSAAVCLFLRINHALFGILKQL